jgi:multicopper oxidase
VLTQDAIAPGGRFIYEFTPPDAGTYLYHSHVGLQLDRGLVGPLVVEPRREDLSYDREATLVLDDWLDGVAGRSPELTLEDLGRTGMGGMSGMAMPMGGGSRARTDAGTLARELLAGRGDPGDVRDPLYLVKGATAQAPPVFDAGRGDRVRVRLINGAADTIFAVWVEEHEMTVTHTDGLEVVPRRTDAVVLGMGERYDALV